MNFREGSRCACDSDEAAIASAEASELIRRLDAQPQGAAGLKLRDLADLIKASPFTVIRRENNLSKPDRTIQKRLRRVFELNDAPDRRFEDPS